MPRYQKGSRDNVVRPGRKTICDHCGQYNPECADCQQRRRHHDARKWQALSPDRRAAKRLRQAQLSRIRRAKQKQERQPDPINKVFGKYAELRKSM